MPVSKEKKTAPDAEFALDGAFITRSYQENLAIYEALRDEIVFIIKSEISASSIKIHDIESRVKELPSLLGKCIRKSTNDPFSIFSDIAAARIVCLFRSDLEALKKIIHGSFEVLSVDDKIESGSDPLNYLSVHMICKMKEGYSGPRYDRILGKEFEIQLRTLCMHCWAAVSHYVDYKGDWDVPANLKMALSALSGLFYVADSEFEQFNAAMVASKKAAETPAVFSNSDSDINLDTVTALLRRIFPERNSSSTYEMSRLVQEIKEADFKSLKNLQSSIVSGIDSVIDYEKKNKSGEIFFTDIGATRHALESVSKSFAEIRKLEYEKMVAKVIKNV